MEEFTTQKNKYETSLVKIGEEKILYITIPYKGCTQCPKCIFCGVQEQSDKNLRIDETFEREVLNKVKEFVYQNSPDSIVLYNGGNVLRPEEMSQKTILTDIPEFIASDPNVKSYELEARVDDIIRFKENIKTIQKNLKEKELKIRLGIEFFDDELLKRHQKGIDTEQIQQVVNFLNKEKIKWNGYALLGGLDVTKEQTRESTIKSGEFMIDNNAFKISINGVFLTKKLQKSFGERIYVPDYEDLVFVLTKLNIYRDLKSSKSLFKVGLEEENKENIARFPYASNKYKKEEISTKLEEFNSNQDLKSLA